MANSAQEDELLVEDELDGLEVQLGGLEVVVESPLKLKNQLKSV